MNDISSCDENRLRQSQEIEESFDQARALAAAGKYKKALDRYLFAFDNGKYVDGWGGVRLSYIPSEIAELGSKYPPALDALHERRDAREDLIRKGKADHDIVSEWLSINRYLGDNDRMLEMIDDVSDELRIKIIEECFEQLLEKKQYKLAGEVLNEQGRRFFNWEFLYETDKYFPNDSRNPHLDHEQMVEHTRQVLRQYGLEVFELALAVKRSASALEVARRVLLHCKDADTYIAVLDIAKRVGSRRVLNQLLKQAKSQLAPKDFARVKRKQSLET